MLHVGTVSTNTVISGMLEFLDMPCISGVKIEVSLVSPSHDLLDARTETFHYSDSSALTVKMKTVGAKYLLLSLSGSAEGNAQTSCRFRIDQIRLEPG